MSTRSHKTPRSPGSSMDRMIRVRGARVHNLRGLDVDIPRDQLVAITGVSGSGKSTLALEVIFAEGQRRFLQGLTPGQRSRLDRWERSEVDLVEGLPAAVCIDQRSGSTAARSTLATMTEIHSHLRLLFARVGQVHCTGCGRRLESRSPQAIVDVLQGLGEKRRVMLLAPVVSRRRGRQLEVFEQLATEGFVRARVDGELVELSPPPELDSHLDHSVDAVIDRVVIRDGLGPRLQDSVELALRVGSGRLIVSCEMPDGGWDDTLYSSRLACGECEWSAPPIEPRTLSFNSPEGACETCRGLGRVGEPGEESECSDCNGTRLRGLAQQVTFHDDSIVDICRLSVEEAHTRLSGWLESSEDDGTPESAVIRKVLPHLVSRLGFLERVGLNYLTLDRSTRTLSGGEFQRSRLAGALGSGLIGVGYVLDEPTIGLHATDSQKLVSCLEDLRDQGNSVLLVEHDLAVLRQADWIVDLGPGGGRRGGRLVVSGPPEDVMACSESVTGAHLAGRMAERPRQRREVDPDHAVTLRRANLNNLKDLEVAVPLGVLCAVTGVSGSGKTSLVSGTLVPLLSAELSGRKCEDVGTPAAELDWPEDSGLDRVVLVDQSSLGRSPRSTPATYTKIWDEIRKVFAQTRMARAKGFDSRRFSFNTDPGRCEECSGRGHVTVEMQFLPDLVVPCRACEGRRFDAETLRVKYRGKSVAEVLEMSAADAVEFFENFPRVVSLLQTLVDTGLGYMVIGQPTATLSGGEAQRVRLSTELGRRRRGPSLFVLDEPTTGLHADDVSRLIEVFDRLVDAGNSVVVIEHHPELIAAADWVIDLGPGGGAGGGRLVATGTPHQLVDQADSATGQMLREVLNPAG